MKRTTLSISNDTKDKLASLGKKGESFDIILRRILSESTTLCDKAIQDDDVAEPGEEE